MNYTLKIQKNKAILAIMISIIFFVVENLFIKITFSILKMVHHKDFIFSLSDDKRVLVWSHPNMELVDELYGHKDGVTSICFANNCIYTGSYDNSIRSWDYADMVNRIKERKNMQAELFYSLRMNPYMLFMEKKKKKRKGGMKKGMKK